MTITYTVVSYSGHILNKNLIAHDCFFLFIGASLGVCLSAKLNFDLYQGMNLSGCLRTELYNPE